MGTLRVADRGWGRVGVALCAGIAGLAGCAQQPTTGRSAEALAIVNPVRVMPQHVVVARGDVVLEVFKPDGEPAVYRGVRFDRSSMARLRVAGVHLFGELRERNTPPAFGIPVGPAEEFDLEGPATYDEAAPGEGFVKIGVGVLRRLDEEPYRFFNHGYELLDAGVWTFTPVADGVRITHTLTGPRGVAYRYEKTITLTDDEPRPDLLITRTLTNTGTRTLTTTHYSHNLFQLGGLAVFDAQHRVGFAVEPVLKRGEPRVRMDGTTLVFTGEGEAGTTIYGAVDGPFDDASANFAELSHGGLGVSVTVTGDAVPSRVAVWANDPLISPEVFVPIVVEPGGSARWSTRYRVSGPSPTSVR